MKASALIKRRETVVKPYASVSSVEAELLEQGYLVVKDGPYFMGILVQADVIEKAHSLIIDCLTAKPCIREDDSLEEALRAMRAGRSPFLPVLDGAGAYLGSVGIDDLLGELVSMRRAPVNVSVSNLIGPGSIEECKHAFIGQLTHHVKNPLQVIMSSTSLIQEAGSDQEREILLDSIHTSAKNIDSVLDSLMAQYF